jgi:SAM-dependent methyltransferase
MNKTPYDIENEIEGFHWWFSARRQLLKRIISSIHVPLGCITVDIGCGTGSNLKALGVAGLKVIGLDLSLYALSLAKRKSQLPVINGDVNKLPFRPKSIGLIIAMDIIEHLENDVTGIREFYEILKDGGILILTVPAFNFLWGVQDIVTGHKRRYLKRELISKLRREKFEVLKSSYFNFFLFFPIFLARRMIHFLRLRLESENKINLPLINFLLKRIFLLEIYLLKYFQFPFGVSLFCIAKKVE